MEKKTQKMKKIKKMIWILLLCILLQDAKTQVYAAETLDRDRMCGMFMKVPAAHREKVKNAEISVRLYRVADIKEDGSFENLPELASLAFDRITSDTTARELERIAEETAAFLQVKNWEDVSVVTPYKEFVLTNAEASVSDIRTGMYLVCMKPFEWNGEHYQALPYLISFPTLVMISDPSGNRQQEWNYDLIVDLKLGCKKNTQTVTVDIPKTEEEKETEEYEAPQEPQRVRYKTGDEENLVFWGVITVLLGGILGGLCIYEKHKKKQDEDKQMD